MLMSEAQAVAAHFFPGPVCFTTTPRLMQGPVPPAFRSQRLLYRTRQPAGLCRPAQRCSCSLTHALLHDLSGIPDALLGSVLPACCQLPSERNVLILDLLMVLNALVDVVLASEGGDLLLQLCRPASTCSPCSLDELSACLSCCSKAYKQTPALYQACSLGVASACCSCCPMACTQTAALH